jgi:hypothetical protein
MSFYIVDKIGVVAWLLGVFARAEPREGPERRGADRCRGDSLSPEILWSPGRLFGCFLPSIALSECLNPFCAFGE